MENIVIANQKGGVAKTTTACAISALLTQKGYRVLAVDMDAQANLTENSGIKPTEDGTYAVLNNEKTIKDVIVKGEMYDVLPATILLAALEQSLNGAMGREYRLSDAFQEAELSETYDFCIIDTPPALGNLTTNALVVGNYVIIPTMADMNALKGIEQLSMTINNVRRYFNPNLKIMGIILTRCDNRLIVSKKSKEICKMLASAINTQFFDIAIRASKIIPESSFFGNSILNYAPNSTVVKDYEAMVEEIIKAVGVEKNGKNK